MHGKIRADAVADDPDGIIAAAQTIVCRAEFFFRFPGRSGLVVEPQHVVFGAQGIVTLRFLRAAALSVDVEDGFFQNDNLHRLSSDFAIIKDKNVTMKQNAIYQNSDKNLTYSSNELIWGEGFLRSNVPFTITQNGDRISGASGSYDINNKKIKAKNVKGVFNR